MNKITSKDLRKDYYFVLYDFDDFPVCYFDNFDELSYHVNYSCFKLAYMFNVYGNLLHVKIGNKIYKIFATSELEDF